MEKKTHNQVVLNYLRNHKKKGLTVKEASDKLGINRVENNICFLRKQGYARISRSLINMVLNPRMESIDYGRMNEK